MLDNRRTVNNSQFPFTLEVGAGNVPNFEIVHVRGRHTTSGADFEVCWTPLLGNYSFPSIATTMSVASTSTDDAAAGAGTQSIKVCGLDGNRNILMGTGVVDEIAVF